MNRVKREGVTSDYLQAGATARAAFRTAAIQKVCIFARRERLTAFLARDQPEVKKGALLRHRAVLEASRTSQEFAKNLGHRIP